MKTKKGGIPKQLFEKCCAIVLISVVEAGFIFTGNVGTGILLRRTKNADGTSAGWSLPSACGLTGLGYGLIAGASLKDIVVFIMDEHTIDAMTTKKGLKLGVQGELTLGPIGRTMKFDVHASGKGFGSTISVAYSRGLFGGISLEGSVVGTREECNKKFYGEGVTAVKILNGQDVTLPEGKITLIEDVYSKLNSLSAATESIESNESKIDAKIEAAMEEADKAAESLKDGSKIVKEAAKEEAYKGDAPKVHS